MASRSAKITKTLIDGLKPLDGDELVIRDSDLDGFGFRLLPTGSASYFVRYAVRDGARRKFRRQVIAGRNAAPDEARRKAKQFLAEVALGADPAAEKEAARAVLTVEQICVAYLEAARAGQVLTRFRRPKSASTVEIDQGRVSRHIVPLIGALPVTALDRRKVQGMVDDIASGKTAGVFKTKARGVAKVEGGPGTAARVVELLGGIWSWAEKRGLVDGDSPTRGVERYRGEAKDRVLTPAEIARLGATLRKFEETRPAAVAALRLIALTGLRREEACALRWDEIDGAHVRLRKTKTGRSSRPLGRPARDLLATLSRVGNHVFPDRSANGSADLKKSIADLFDAAGLEDARSHDLRRTFASVAAEEGFSDATIGEMLGHARKGVTARHYIRRSDAALVAAADKVAESICSMLKGNVARVIHLPSTAATAS